MPNFAEYLSRYEHEHHNGWNKLLHGIGIPVIFAGIFAFFLDWRWGLGLFAGGWILLFVGHRIEGNNPAFFQGPIYFLVGPLWVAKELRDFLLRKPSRAAEGK
jgi:uncharacterized membrane protein YGL010W